MATEIDIPESDLLKELKTEINAFSSESLEEKVRELVDNKVKHLETSNLVAEPVNTKLETGIMTNESETFFQAPSVPTVTADELSKTPETTKDTPKQEDQKDIKVTKIEALTDEKPVDDVVEAVLTQTEREVETIGNEDKNDGKAIQIDEETQEKEQALNTLKKDKVVDYKKQDLNKMPREFVKEETEDISNDVQEASEQRENGPNKKQEQKPEESVKNIVLPTAEIKQEEKAEAFPGVERVEEVKQNGLLHEEKGEEATQSNDGQKEKSENPSITKVREENSSEKIEFKGSTPIATVNKDEAEYKEQDVNVLEKDQGEDEVTSIQDLMPAGGLEETKHQGDCNEAEVNAKESMEKETEEIIYSVGTPENIEPQSLTDSSITAHTKPEETMQNEEQNHVEAIDIEDGETKDSGSSTVKEINEEPVSDKANSEEGLRPSESSNKESIKNDAVSKDEGQEKNDVECSQDEPSTGDMDAKTNETITNDEKATEKEASDETGPVNSESEVGLEVSGSMEPTKVEVFSTIEKSQGDTDGVISSQDATCEDIKETNAGENDSTVADTEELNEMPREFKEEAEGKSIDSKASYHSEKKAEEKLVGHPDESLNEIEQKEDVEDIRPSAVLEEKLVQVETWEHEEKVEAEATQSDYGQMEKFDNPAVTKVCEENSSEKVESESSSMMLNEQVTSILTKDEDEEKEQEDTVVKKDQGEESVTSAQDVAFEGCLEETNHDSEGIETEVINAKGSVEEDNGENKSSSETLEEKEQTVNPTDVSITTQTKQEEETIENEEKNDEEAVKSDYGETEESGSLIVSEICEETVSHNTESEEGLKDSEIARKDEIEAPVQDRYEDDVTFSQAATSIEDLHVGNKENIKKEEKNAEEAIEKEPCEDMGPKNVESEVGLKVSDSMEPSVKEAFNTEKKDQGDTDGIPRSLDETCVDVKETTPTIVGDFKEVSETPREFIKEETENKTIDAEEINADYENKAEEKLLERSLESVKEIEKEVEIEEIRASLEVEEKLEKSELLQGVTTDASISTQTEPQDEMAEPDNKDEEEAGQSDDGQKEKYDNSSINAACEEISSEKVESESSGVKLNEIVTSFVNKDEKEEKEQEISVLEKDQGEDRVTSAQNVPFEGCLEEANHDSEFIEPEVADAKRSIEDASEEIRSSVKTPEDGTPETEVKNDGEAIKSDDGQVGIIVNEICEETVSHNTESEEGPTVFDTSSKETNEHKLASKDETKEKNQDQEEDDVMVSQSATFLEDLKVENNDTTINEEANEKEAGEDMGTDNVGSGVSLKTTDNIEPSVKEVLTTVGKEQGDMDGVPSSQDAICEDTETTSTIVSDFKELNETTREFIKEETEDKTSDVQEANDDFEDKAEESLVEQPVESFKEVEKEAETEENRPSVLIEEKLEQNELSHDVTADASIFTETKSQVEITEPEEKGVPRGEETVTSAKDVPSEACLEETSHENEGIESEAKNAQGSVEDDTKEIRSSVETLEEGATENKENDEDEAIKNKECQTKESGIPIVDEICEETLSHNTESEEGLNVSDISSKETNEHELVSKDEAEEKVQDQEKDDVTCSHDKTSIENLQENKNESTIKEDKNDEVTIQNEASEETNVENAESEVVLKHSDDMEPSKNEALNTIEKDQGNLDGVTSSQDATIVDEFKELNEEERPREFFKEETKDNLTEAQEATEKCENGAQDNIEQKPEESVKKIEQEEEKTEATNSLVEIEEQNELLCDVTSDESSISSQTKPEAETLEHEEKNEEVATLSDDTQKEKDDKPSIKEVCEDEKSETVEYETSTPITIISKDEDQEHDQAVNMLEKDEGEDAVTNSLNATLADVCISTQPILEKDITENEENNAEEVVDGDDSQTMKSGIPVDKEICEEIVSQKVTKDEDQDLDVSENNQSGGEDVKSSQIAASEDLKETTIAQYVATVAYSEEPPALSAIPKETPMEETDDRLIDVQKARAYEDREMPKEIVNGISSKTEKEGYMDEIKTSVETNEEKDVCISTPTEAHEEATQIEEKDLQTIPEDVIDLSNSSDVNRNEKDISILSNDEVKENEQELNISEEDQGKDEVTCSQDPVAVSEEELQGKYEDEDAEQKLVETRKIPKEYNEVIQTSGETEEKLEQQIASKQEITEKEVCEETVKVVCEEATSEKVESIEALELSDSSEIKINEKTVTCSKDEGQEETTEIEEKNDGMKNEDVIRSDDQSKEELKESTSESVKTVTYTGEGQDLSTMTKEILENETEDKPVDAQQASEESENRGKDEREQHPEESVDKQVDSCTNVVEENIKEGESDSGKKEEVDIEKQNNEVGEADGVKEYETIDGTQELSPENKDEVTGSPLGDETDDQTLNKKEDQYTETEKMLSELENSKDENVEKIPACSTEEEITEKSEDLTHDSIKEIESTTKEEQSIVDGRTREIEISTLEHEPIGEQIGGIDEVSKDKSTDPKETAEVEPQEDITPLSSIETSTVDTSNSDKKKAQNEDSPIEDVDSAYEVHTPEVVSESKDSKLKEECVNTTTRSYVEETKEIVTEEISSAEKIEQPVEIEKESVEEVCEQTSIEKTETGEYDKSSVEIKENAEQQGSMHVITSDVCTSSEKLLDAVKEIDTKEDIEVIATAKEKEIEQSNQDAMAEVMVHEHLQQTEEVILEVENSKESKIIEDNIDEEARCIQDSTKDTIEPKWTVETPTEVCEFTSEAAEIVTDQSTEASPKILLVKHDSDIATNTEKIEDGIKERDAIFQAPNLSSESGKGEQNSIADMLNKAGEGVQPQEHISSTKSDVEIKEEVELMHSGSQQTSVEKKTKDLPVLLSEVKEQSEEAPLKDDQKDFDHTTEGTIVDVANAECLNVEPQHLNIEEATLPSVNHENQTEQINKADKNIDSAIYIEDVKSSDVELQSDMDVPVPNCTSTRKLEVRSADLEVPSAMDAKDDKINLGSTCDKGKTTEEVSGIKQEQLEIDAPVNTVATKDLDISNKGVTGDVIKEGRKLSDVKSESAAPTKEEIADSGVKTEEENEEQEDNEDNENSGVMVEASKDMEVKVHKKSHNILSGVGSKVKHSIAKVKKAITGGKSSSPKPPSPKERD